MQKANTIFGTNMIVNNNNTTVLNDDMPESVLMTNKFEI